MFQKIFNGGFLKSKKVYVSTCIGIIGAIGAFMIGDVNLFEMLGIIFPLLSVFFLRKSANS